MTISYWVNYKETLGCVKKLGYKTMTFRKIAYSIGYEKEKLEALFSSGVLSTRLGWMTDTELDDIRGLIISLEDSIKAEILPMTKPATWSDIWYLERDIARGVPGRYPETYYHPISRRRVDNILRLEVSGIIDHVLGVTTIKPY